jgi:glucose-1-phosphate thymidylyltransferase
MHTLINNKKHCSKGIILAGGTGSRLYPMTKLVNKQLLPLYDKPVIYYSLTTLMLAGIRDILIICTPYDLPKLIEFLQNGHQWNINLSYATQVKPSGIPEAFLIGEEFINNEPIAMILGDNVFHGQGFSSIIHEVANAVQGVHLFAYTVRNPEDYGVVVLDKKGVPIEIEEKPKNPKSNQAVTGLYFYDNNVVTIAKSLKPSKRGELEITDINRVYIKNGLATVHVLNRGFAWFDVGTPEALAKASQYIQVLEDRQDIAIACPEEVAWRMGWIDEKILANITADLPNSKYKNYLIDLLNTSQNENEYVGTYMTRKLLRNEL